MDNEQLIIWWTASVVVSAMLLDKMLGEPRRWHPLCGYGRLVRWTEYRIRTNRGFISVLRGLAAVLLLTAVPVAAIWKLHEAVSLPGKWLLEVWLLYFAIGANSLVLHAQNILKPLYKGDVLSARKALSLIVSRDTASLDDSGIATATVESVLENGNDAIFASLFWYLLAGAPGVLAHRLLNTLDAMWGYRTDEYRYFGYAAARLDDVMAYFPARLTALSYSLVGNTAQALRAWRCQSPACASPNAGPVMAAGAGALDLELGGAFEYHGELVLKPKLGYGRPAGVIDIEASLKLITKSIQLWMLCIIAVGVMNFAFR